MQADKSSAAKAYVRCASAAKDLRDDVASYRANGTIVTDETLRGWERRLTKLDADLVDLYREVRHDA